MVPAMMMMPPSSMGRRATRQRNIDGEADGKASSDASGGFATARGGGGGTASASGSATRICGAPQCGQNAVPSSIVDPHLWQAYGTQVRQKSIATLTAIEIRRKRAKSRARAC
jgi:hypothetical protein